MINLLSASLIFLKINLLRTSLDGGLINGGLVVVTRAGALVVGGGRAGRLQI